MEIGGVVSQEVSNGNVNPTCAVIPGQALLETHVSASQLTVEEVGPDSVDGDALGVAKVGSRGCLEGTVTLRDLLLQVVFCHHLGKGRRSNVAIGIHADNELFIGGCPELDSLFKILNPGINGIPVIGGSIGLTLLEVGSVLRVDCEGAICALAGEVAGNEPGFGGASSSDHMAHPASQLGIICFRRQHPGDHVGEHEGSNSALLVSATAGSGGVMSGSNLEGLKGGVSGALVKALVRAQLSPVQVEFTKTG